MYKYCIYWLIINLCLIEISCDDEPHERTRIPQIELGDMIMNSDQGNQGNTDGGEVCQRTFMYAARTESPREVKLAGTFESPMWRGEITLSDEDNDGLWLATVSIPEGTYQYKWMIDGIWRPDLDNERIVDDGSGGLNNIFTHSCPFQAECLNDSECSGDNDYCLNLSCRATSSPILCDRCPDGCDLLTGACIEAPLPECDDRRPCTSPLICESGQCVPECEVDSDCSQLDIEALCIDLECIIPECQDGTACDPLEESCLDYRCAPRPCAERLFLFDPPNGEEYDSIHVAGDFNADAEGQWPITVEAGGWAMQRLADGRYYSRQNIPNGSYAYKFVLMRAGQSDWIADPRAETFVDDGFGGQNSFLEQRCENAPIGVGQCGDLSEFKWEDAVMYFAMIDRFHNSDGERDPILNVTEGNAAVGPSGQYEGGDLVGVSNKLSYLTELGVNALWLSAPYDNRDFAGAAIDPNRDPNTYSGYHGYWPSPANISYIDPLNPSPRPAVESRIGTEADLHALVDAAHDQDVKVLFDYVMNHVDSESGLAQANPSWFARRENGQIALCGPENLWDDPYWGTRCAFTDYLPPFDFDNVEARQWSVKDALWWAREFDIDGYRLDAIKHVPLSWLEDLRQALNQEFSEPEGGRFYLVGETFAYDNAELIRSFVDAETLLDGQFDFPFKARLCEALFRPEGRLDGFAGWMNSNDDFYGEGSLMTTWIGNHDIPRAIHFASGEIDNCRQGSSSQNGWYMSYPQPQDAAPYERLGLAFAVMLTNPGIPLIYYGDEIGLAGGGDPDNRRLMPWNDQDLSSYQLQLRTLISRLTELRSTHPNLSRGRRVTLSSNQDTWVYRMLGCGGDTLAVTIAINRADSDRSVNLPSGSFTDLLNEESIEGGTLTMEPRSVRILVDASAL